MPRHSRVFPLGQSDEGFIRQAANVLLVEGEFRIGLRWAIDGKVGEEDLHTARGEIDLESGLRRNSRRKCALDAQQIVRNEIAAISVRTQPDELLAAGDGVQRVDQLAELSL